jgi:hypothetical protein
MRMEDPRRLHYINALFAHLTGHDLYLAQQIKEAIAFSLIELEEQMKSHPDFVAKYDAAFNAAAGKLLTDCFRHQPKHGFFHWDAARTQSSATQLFARAELMEGIKQLSPFHEATMLITNLRPALLPLGHNKKQQREQEYAEALEFIRDLAAARIPRFTNLQLLFL